MSLDISVYKKDDEGISLNWLRNPFGLERWAGANTKLNLKKDLWYVCNRWNYKKANRVNRQLFLKVVLEYWREIEKLTEGYFFFNVPEYQQFIEGNTDKMVCGSYGIKGKKYEDGKIAVPMWQFKHPSFHLPDCTLEHYKIWFKELVEFAELLQDKSFRFYCSN